MTCQSTTKLERVNSMLRNREKDILESQINHAISVMMRFLCIFLDIKTVFYKVLKIYQ